MAGFGLVDSIQASARIAVIDGEQAKHQPAANIDVFKPVEHIALDHAARFQPHQRVDCWQAVAHSALGGPVVGMRPPGGLARCG